MSEWCARCFDRGFVAYDCPVCHGRGTIENGWQLLARIHNESGEA